MVICSCSNQIQLFYDQFFLAWVRVRLCAVIFRLFFLHFCFVYIHILLHRQLLAPQEGMHKIILSLHTIMMNYRETQVNGNFLGIPCQCLGIPSIFWDPWMRTRDSQVCFGQPKNFPRVTQVIFGTPTASLGIPRLHVWLNMGIPKVARLDSRILGVPTMGKRYILRLSN